MPTMSRESFCAHDFITGQMPSSSTATAHNVAPLLKLSDRFHTNCMHTILVDVEPYDNPLLMPFVHPADKNFITRINTCLLCCALWTTLAFIVSHNK
eukprot:XP_001698465.1 predicted protein [Chlamydomonas reinhardtii]